MGNITGAERLATAAECNWFAQEAEAAGGPPVSAVQSQPAPPAGLECQTEQRDGREVPPQDQSRGGAADCGAPGQEGESRAACLCVCVHTSLPVCNTHQC